MDDIINKLDKKPSDYKMAFINTASEVEDGDLWWIRTEKDKLSEVGFNNVDEFSITGMTRDEIEDKLVDKDIIYFCGGNTFYLLDQVIKTGTDEIIKRKIDEGVVYIGSSAGSMIVGKNIDMVCEIDDKSKAPDLKSDGLGIIDMAVLPHWGSDHFKDEYLAGFSNIYTTGTKIALITDDQYLWIKDDIIQLVQV